MKMPNFSSIDMEIHDSADLTEALQMPLPESTFQVGESQLKAIRELAKILFNNSTTQKGCT